MYIGFYYAGWNDNEINGTQDAVKTLSDYINSEKLGVCNIYNRHSINENFNLEDIIVVITAHTGLFIKAYDSPFALWNHCWDYEKTVEKWKHLYENIIALSPKHAQHLNTTDWCYPPINPKIFHRTNAQRKKKSVIYCGGKKWWKGYKATGDIKTKFQNMAFQFEEIWGLPHKQLAQKFNETQFVIIPSEVESFCLVSAQAQACGCIPIAHDVGGISETIPEELKQWCLYKDTINYDALKDIPENAPQICIENAKKFHVEKTAQKFLTIIKNTIKKAERREFAQKKENY